MIDIDAAYRWLQEKVRECQSADLRFAVMQDSSTPKPGVAVEAEGKDIAGLFCLWDTGESDFDISVGDRFVSHEWGRIVDNASLPDAFHQFLSELKRLSDD